MSVIALNTLTILLLTVTAQRCHYKNVLESKSIDMQ